MTNRRVPFNPWTAKMLTFSARGREVAQMRSTVIGVLMPEDFNTAAHNDISALLAGCVRTHATEWMHFASAWNAVAIRFHSLASADYAYQSLITGVRDSPERNCEVQQVLFDFFCRGASVIESFFHAIRAIGSISAPAAFPLNGDADLKDWPIDGGGPRVVRS